jgi:MoaA/NifB/PqqE/SkfB family radical SAM enzyme
MKNRISEIAPGIKNLILRNTCELLYPKWLWFEVTDKCNCKCNFCNIWRQNSAKNVLTPAEIDKTFSDKLFQGLKYILLSGGEPVIRPDIKDVIAAIHKSVPKATIQLSTNGFLAERILDVVKFAIEEQNINFEVGVSLDGIGQEHDKIRGRDGVFNKVDWLLKELVVLRNIYNNQLSLAVGFVLTDANLFSMEKVKEYTQKMNLSLSVQWYNQSPYYGNIGKSLLNDSEFLISSIHSSSSTIINEMGLRLLKGKSIKFPCFAMYTFCLLDCSGDIIPCFNLWDSKIGNVRKISPTDIWHSRQAKESRKVVKNCRGCLNGCGVGWSFESCVLPFLPFYIKRGLGLFK